MEDNNFIRAREECKKALELAEKLKDSEKKELYNSYLVCLEAVISADDQYEEGDYTQAKDAYLTAMARVRYADNAGLSYIEKKLEQIREYEQVFDYITLGDSLLELESRRKPRFPLRILSDREMMHILREIMTEQWFFI